MMMKISASIHMPGAIYTEEGPMSESTTILVVDDEPELRAMLQEYLSKRGCTVFTADGGTTMRRLLMEHPIDVVLLDLRMPGEDGLSLAQYVRARYTAGIIMLTAASDVTERIAGLNLGADDYVTKPFDPRELLARIKSVQRRVQTRAAGSGQTRVRFGICILDLTAQKLLTSTGNELSITSMEFALLQTFATHPNQVLTRDQLLEMAHSRGWEPFDRSIDLRISRLRRKIENDPVHPQTIKTVRGSGYMFVPSESDR
jgi:two-component system phosphate regulon response regulator OmpR